MLHVSLSRALHGHSLLRRIALPRLLESMKHIDVSRQQGFTDDS